MTTYYNTDPAQTRQQTKYPFTVDSTLVIGNSYLPATWISSLHFAVYSAVFPLHIQTCKAGDSGNPVIQICDSEFSVVAKVELNSSGKSAVRTLQGILCGTMLYVPQLLSFMSGLVSDRSQYTFNNTSMIISPQCIQCQAVDGCRFVQYSQTQDIYYTGTVQVQLQQNAYIQKSNSYCTISVAGDWQQPQNWQHRLRKVNGVNMSGGYLVIKPEKLSDLRIITDSSNIIFAGVKDAR